MQRIVTVTPTMVRGRVLWHVGDTSVEGGRCPTADGFRNLPLLTAGGFEEQGYGPPLKAGNLQDQWGRRDRPWLPPGAAKGKEVMLIGARRV
jgi:hypothetical protein